ncbi:MAG: hypothetical protein ACTSXF_15815, partial [Promethearchaeota archaeon]
KHNSPFSSTDGLNYVINTTQTSCNITGLALGIWYFRVLPARTGFNGSLSNMVNISVEALPPAPILLSVEYGYWADYNSFGVKISWKSVPNVDGYRVYKSDSVITNDTDINSLRLVIPNLIVSNEIVDTACGGGIKYYVVVAVNSTGQSQFSNVISVDCKSGGIGNQNIWLYVAFAAIGGVGVVILLVILRKRSANPENIYKKDDKNFDKYFNQKLFDIDDDDDF